MTEMDLAIMIADAYDACKSESMNCPWCSGYVSHGSGQEWHDKFCKWDGFKRCFDLGEYGPKSMSWSPLWYDI